MPVSPICLIFPSVFSINGKKNNTLLKIILLEQKCY